MGFAMNGKIVTRLLRAGLLAKDMTLITGIEISNPWIESTSMMITSHLIVVSSAIRYHHGDRGKTLIRPVDQRYNWRNPKLVDFKGEKMTIPEIARRSGISQTTIRIRYAKGLRGDELVKRTNRTKPRSNKTA